MSTISDLAPIEVVNGVTDVLLSPLVVAENAIIIFIEIDLIAWDMTLR
jgi:hypothetical protein